MCLRERSQAFTCIAGVPEEVARFEFPADVEIIATPKPVSLKAEYVDYRADYQREGNTVVVTRRLDFHNPGAVCSPEMFRALQPTLEAMIHDLGSQVIVQKS